MAPQEASTSSPQIQAFWPPTHHELEFSISKACCGHIHECVPFLRAARGSFAAGAFKPGMMASGSLFLKVENEIVGNVKS